MTVIVPLQAVPAQTLDVLLDEQATTLEIRQLSLGLFMNILVDKEEIVGFTVCENLNRIVRNKYLGFQGDFVFLDNTGGGQDPDFTGLGDGGRFSLVYLSASELPAGGR